MPRTALLLGSLIALAIGLTACAAEPEPEPEWTEESAYAEAEEVFRAYWNVDFDGDIPKKLMTPSMAAAEEEGREELANSGVEFRGVSEITSVKHVSYRTVGESAVVTLQACIDASELEMRGSDGQWRQPRTESTYGVEAQLESRAENMLVADMSEPEGIEC